jgi:hypothetical protein
MPTLRGQLAYVNVDWRLVNQISTVVYVGCVAFVWWFSRRFADDKHWWMAGTACALLVTITFGLHCHQYDVLLAVPAIAVLAKEAYGSKDYVMLCMVNALTFSYLLAPYMAINYYYLHGFKDVPGGPMINPHFALLLGTTICAFLFVRKSALKRRHSLQDAPHPVRNLGSLVQSGI